MSHSKERKEKVCLNCKTELLGRFCHVCGQENIEPKETVWGLITHFFHDITHFDGKFFDTAKWLIRRPGFLSREYVNGRRASYLNPVRMYVFTSAFFFILFFSFFVDVDSFFVKSGESPVVISSSDSTITTKRDTSNLKPGEIWRYQPANPDTSKKIETAQNPKHDLKDSSSSTVSTNKEKIDTVSKKIAGGQEDTGIDLNTQYTSLEQYDSAQKALPENQRDGWFGRILARKEIQLKPKFERNWKETSKEVAEKFVHYFPQLLFVSLPLIALVLMLLYIRRKKEFYFVSHGIFLIHIYIYSFVNLTLFFLLTKLKAYLGW